MTNRNFVLPVYRRFGSYEEVSPVNRLPVSSGSVEVIKNWSLARLIQTPVNIFPGSGLSDVIGFSALNLDFFNLEPLELIIQVSGFYLLDPERGIVSPSQVLLSETRNITTVNTFTRFTVDLGYQFDCVQVSVYSIPDRDVYYRVVGVL